MTLADTLYLNGTRYEAQPAADTIRFVGWRNLHAPEGGFLNPRGMPNVRRAVNAPPVPFTAALQRLSFDLMTFKNPSITRDKWEGIFAGDTAFNNRHGVESSDAKLMDGIICAGMFGRFEQDGGYLVARPGVHAIDATKPLPTVAEILERGWYFVATTGTGSQGAFNFPQGNGGPVYILYALVEPVRYPMTGADEGRFYTNFARWDSTVLPDPLRYGG